MLISEFVLAIHFPSLLKLVVQHNRCTLKCNDRLHFLIPIQVNHLDNKPLTKVTNRTASIVDSVARLPVFFIGVAPMTNVTHVHNMR